MKIIIKIRINMKQLFVDILTKLTPKTVTSESIKYTLNTNPETEVTIMWRYIKEDQNPKMEFVLPFAEDIDFGTHRKLGDYHKKAYIMFINSMGYYIDLNPVEMCEIDRIVYNIFANYQSNTLKSIRSYIDNLTNKPLSPDQRFEEAQEAIANNE